MKTTLISILTVLASFFPLYGVEKNDTLQIYFRQGHSEIDSTLHGNAATLSRLDSIFKPEGTKLRNVRIVGCASPEGSVNLNNNLSDHRARRILNLIEGNQERNNGNQMTTDRSNAFENTDIEFSFVGRDWANLLKYANNDPNIPYRYETVSLLEEINNELSEEDGEREANHFLIRLKKLRNGEPYAYLYSNIFPFLRASRVYLNYYILPPFEGKINGPDLSIGTLDPAGDIILSHFAHASLPREKRKFYIALKTNMLYDALALPSLSAEFYLGKNFSAVANWTYGWWDTDRTHHYWRAYGGDLAVRWWFGKKAMEKPLTGHHIGVYGGIFTYDFEFGGTGYMGGLPHETLWNRSLRMAGIEYGYSLPVAKRLNIDFTIGIGYMGGKYIKYIPDNGRYLWQSTHKINWFGPTKAEISLVWLIGPGNYNLSKKGGEK